MSCFIVSEQHIDFLITAAVTHGLLDESSPLALKIAVLKLERENQASVDNRYPHIPAADRNMRTVTPERAPRLLGRRDRTLVTPIQILKAIECYVYQSSEHEGWKTSEARDFCDHLRDYVIKTLPGYDDAAWSL